MSIMRPSGGFKITLAPAVQELIDQRIDGDPAFKQHWDDILERLRFTAHLEGVPNSRFAKGHRLFAAGADGERGLPRVRLVYSVLGANVRIRVVGIG